MCQVLLNACRLMQVMSSGKNTSPAIIHLHEIKTSKNKFYLLVPSHQKWLLLGWFSSKKFRAAWVFWNFQWDQCNDLIFCIWVFPKLGVGPQNGWFIMVPNPIKMDELGVKTPIFGNTHIEYDPCMVYSPTRWPFWGGYSWPFQGLSDLHLGLIKRSLWRSWYMNVRSWNS